MRPCTCHPDDNPPRPCAERYALSECKRTPPRTGDYPEAGLTVLANGRKGYSIAFYPMLGGITAEQAREAAHLLNQLAEFLEWQRSEFTADQNGSQSPAAL